MMKQTIILLMTLLLLAGCGRNTETTEKYDNTPRIETFSRGPVEVTLTINPPIVHLEKDILLTVQITAPTHVTTTLPRLDDRFQGFLLAESFDPESFSSADQTTKQRVARLTPLLNKEYRIAPIVIEYNDGMSGQTESHWFSTEPIVLDHVAVLSSRNGYDIQDELEPVWIYPPMRTVGLYTLLIAALICLAFIAWRLLKKVHRKIRLMRMSPKERALEELNDLLRKDLLAKNMVKTFYVDLTMVVRRYIERQHSVRAPELTTEEFLQAVSTDNRFNVDTVKKLRDFLESADLVKFAAYNPETNAIDNSIRTARVYIETDTNDDNENE